MSNMPALVMPQAAEKVAAKPRDPFWFRWEIVLPLVVILTFLAGIAGFIERIRSAGK